MIQALQKPRGSQSITSFSLYCSPPKIRSVSFALSAGRRIVQITYNYPIRLYHAKCELFNSHLRSNMQHFYERRDASPHYMPSHNQVQTGRFAERKTDWQAGQSGTHFAACQPANPVGFTLGKQGGLEPLCACWGNLSPSPFERFLQNRLRSCGAFFACGASGNCGVM